MTVASTGATGTDATSTETTTTTEGTQAQGTQTTEGEGTDTVAEVAKWKELARKHEDRAKANASAVKELETLRQQSMTDTEKAIDIARKEATAEAMKTVGGRLVDAEVRAAAAGRADDVVAALLEGLDRSRFLDADGEPDAKAIKAWVDRVAPPVSQEQGFPDLGQGSRQSSSNAALNGDPLLRDIKAKLGVR